VANGDGTSTASSRGDGSQQSSDNGAVSPSSDGATTRGPDGRNASNTAANGRNNPRNPSRGPAPTRGPPASNSDTQGVLNGAVADNDTTGPTLPGANNSTTDTSQTSTADIVAGPRPDGRTPGTADANSGRTTPRNLPALRAQLPRSMRDVPIVRDPSLRGNTVEVHYETDARGRVVGVEIRVGPNVQPRHIADHVNTVRTLQSYQGLSGRIRVTLDKLNALISGNPNLGPGTLAFETRREITKLDAIVKARMRALDSGTLTPEEYAELDAERLKYEAQLAKHKAALPNITDEAGRGFIAAEDTGDSTPAVDHANPSTELQNLMSLARSRRNSVSGPGVAADRTTARGGVSARNNGASVADNDVYVEVNLDLAKELEFELRRTRHPTHGLVGHPGHRNDADSVGGSMVAHVAGSPNVVPGSQNASHAEQLAHLEDVGEGVNEPIGVSREQCGMCRLWFSQMAREEGNTIVVADPSFTRVYYPNGDVAVYAEAGHLVATAVPTQNSTAVTYYDSSGNRVATAIASKRLSLEYGSDNRQVSVSSSAKSVTITVGGQQIKFFPNSLALSGVTPHPVVDDNGNVIATVDQNGNVDLYDAPGGNPIATLSNVGQNPSLTIHGVSSPDVVVRPGTRPPFAGTVPDKYEGVPW
jgi:hypothetical protein